MTETLTNGLTVERLAELVEEEMPGEFKLVYVGYRDELSDERADAALRNDWEAFDEDSWEWQAEQRWSGACDAVDELARDIAMRECDDRLTAEHLLLDFGYSDERHELICLAQERDTSSPEAALIRNTGRVLVRVPIGEVECDEELGYLVDDLLGEHGITTDDEMNRKALEGFAGELCGLNYRVAYAVGYVDLADIALTPGDRVTFVNPNIWITNPYAGDGWMERVRGEITVNRSELATDKRAGGYGVDDVFGLYYPAVECEVKVA